MPPAIINPAEMQVQALPIVITVNILESKTTSLTPQKTNKSDADAYCSGLSESQLQDFKSLSTEQLAGYERPHSVSGKAG
jgi:hypothetical protein